MSSPDMSAGLSSGFSPWTTAQIQENAQIAQMQRQAMIAQRMEDAKTEALGHQIKSDMQAQQTINGMQEATMEKLQQRLTR